MEENSATIQTIVIAHAAFGHNHFFKNNYLFREWTNAEGIVDYLLFSKKYISDCEEKYGYAEVESILDSAHALRNQGVDRYRRPSRLNAEEERKRLNEKDEYIQSQYNPIYDKTIPKESKDKDEVKKVYPSEPQENILKFVEKNSPKLKTWQREIIRIVRMTAQYFYPQRQSQIR